LALINFSLIPSPILTSISLIDRGLKKNLLWLILRAHFLLKNCFRLVFAPLLLFPPLAGLRLGKGCSGGAERESLDKRIKMAEYPSGFI